MAFANPIRSSYLRDNGLLGNFEQPNRRLNHKRRWVSCAAWVNEECLVFPLNGGNMRVTVNKNVEAILLGELPNLD